MHPRNRYAGIEAIQAWFKRASHPYSWVQFRELGPPYWKSRRVVLSDMEAPTTLHGDVMSRERQDTLVGSRGAESRMPMCMHVPS